MSRSRPRAIDRLRTLIGAEEGDAMNARDQLSDYLLGELPAAERAAFEAALRDDAALRDEVERLRPVVTRLEALEPSAWEPAGALPPLPPLPSEVPRARWWRRPLVLRPAPAAALAAALLALGAGAGALLGA